MVVQSHLSSLALNPAIQEHFSPFSSIHKMVKGVKLNWSGPKFACGPGPEAKLLSYQPTNNSIEGNIIPVALLT